LWSVEWLLTNGAWRWAGIEIVKPKQKLNQKTKDDENRKR